MSAKYKNQVTITLKFLLPLEMYAMQTELEELFEGRRYRIEEVDGCLRITLWKDA